ncbi:TIGR03118 family protein [Methylomonas sp. CM2]|uniref:TIGR03118 family protein n=1 Tax=Methylomonas sp. CM2 TaxID=3417647 RepID=UPI003CF39BFE
MSTLSKLSYFSRRTLWTLPLSAALSFGPLSTAAATSFSRVDLVTDDQAANPAQLTDAGLVNAWGISYAPTGPFWISDNGTGLSTLYSVNPDTNATAKIGLTVSIPGAGNVTGQVFNDNLAAFNGNRFIFVNEDGTVSGWRGALGTSAETLVTGSSQNLYKGVAEAALSGNSYLYAANFKSGRIDVFKGTPAADDLSGQFTDPNLPNGYAPFNIQNLNGTLYVTYALQDANSPDEVAGAGLGFVDAFDLQGNLLQRVASQGTLNAPWGLAIAPASFGEFAGDLLVGNFGDGTISAFKASDHSFAGQLTGTDGNPLTIDGLWALSIGNGALAGSANELYFTAGPNDEAHGLFGTVAAVPVPASAWLFGTAILGSFAKRRAKS